MQLIQPKVQKSTSTTFPRRSASRNAESVFSHTWVSISVQHLEQAALKLAA